MLKFILGTVVGITVAGGTGYAAIFLAYLRKGSSIG